MLKFDDAKHEYFVDGRKVPGVTSILSPLIDYSRVPAATLERARRMGQAVHLATELDDQDDLDYDTLSPELLPYLHAWRRFRMECNFVPDTIEKRLYHPALGYAGTSDRTGIVKGKRAVIDIKKMATLGPVVGVQLAAYKELHIKATGVPIEDRYGLALRADGFYRLVPYTDPNDWRVFLSLLTIRNYREKHGSGIESSHTEA